MLHSKYPILSHKIDFFLEHPITVTIVTLFTLYALFADDIRLFVTDKYGDHYIWEIYIVSMIIFTLEITLACLCKPGYFLSFFFYLDCFATISLLLDIGWVTDLFFGDD